MSQNVTRSVVQKTSSYLEKGWKSYEWMKSRIGATKLDKWIEAKVADTRPDPKTGSTEKVMAEY